MAQTLIILNVRKIRIIYNTYLILLYPILILVLIKESEKFIDPSKFNNDDFGNYWAAGKVVQRSGAGQLVGGQQL
jgi:hypothetical protein